MSKYPYTHENARRIEAITRYLEVVKEVEEHLPKLTTKLVHVQKKIDNSPDKIEAHDLNSLRRRLQELAIHLEFYYNIHDNSTI